KSFNAETGALEWTTYTVPGPGEPGNETWPGETWRQGGAPTWVTGSYDPELNIVYWGTGNPGPWDPNVRSGDNLYSNCVLAINPDDGKIKWYFQYTPNDGWDYDGVNTPVLVDVPLQGQPVKALIQPNRNGFFYMLNRETGKFIYAMPMIEGINWTTGIDPVTGRPTPNPEKVVKTGGPTVEDIVPGLEGGVNWSPLAYNPQTRLAYVTVNDWSMSLKAEPVEYKRGQWYTGETYQMYQTGKPTGHLTAIDVVNRRIVWDWPSPLHLFAGTLATAGGLVFTGDAYGYVRAFDDRTGAPLWKFQTGSAINAPVVSYEIDGVQYVAVLSGMGGDLGYYLAGQKSGMLWAFALRNLGVTEDESGGFPQTNDNLKRKP
ncbi:MAG: PQQ-binding-like beta-propeller repeat protein, partial [bacterium]